MAVTSNLSAFSDLEGVPQLVGYGGGQGAAVGNDVVIQGVQSAGRRVDNSVAKGFGVTRPAVNMSAAGMHVKIWLFVTQWSEVTKVVARVSSGADDDHTLPTDQYPSLGGFIPLWLDVSRTPESGGSANESSVNEVGILLDIGDVGGNAPNLILDAIDYGTSGLLWTGASGTIQDFRDYEASNNEGNIVTQNGVDFCYSRLEIGSATSAGFTDSGFKVIYPDQPLVATDFMGLSIDLSNASTSVDLSNASVETANIASATRRPDLVVIGTSGTLNLTSMSILGMRLVELTSSCTVATSTIDSISITQGSSSISSSTIRTRSAASVPCITDIDLSGLSVITFSQAGSGHAFEITGTNQTITLTDINFDGYGADGSTSAAIWVTATGTTTINISGGDTPTIRNTGGGTVNIVNTNTLTLTNLAAGTEVRVYDTASPTSEIGGIEQIIGSSFSTGIDSAAYPAVNIAILALESGQNVFLENVDTSSGDVTIPVQQPIDRQYFNV